MKTTILSRFVLICCVTLGGLPLAACEKSTPSPTAPETSPVTLAIGQSVPLPGTPLSVRFTGVPNDSRCPKEALCIQLGEAVVALEAGSGSNSSRLELRTSDAGRVAHVEGYRIELQSLQPYPSASHPIAPAEYRATLQATAP
jgi:hypothetical protein